MLPLLCAWLACAAVAGLGLSWSERSGRDALTDPFAVRAQVVSDLVSAYAGEVFEREERLAAEMASGDVPLRQFARSTALLG